LVLAVLNCDLMAALFTSGATKLPIVLYAIDSGLLKKKLGLNAWSPYPRFIVKEG
jgi:hypothetical protein